METLELTLETLEFDCGDFGVDTFGVDTFSSGAFDIAELIEKKTPPRGGVSYLLFSLIKNRE